MMKENATFHSFRVSGKWYTTGRGHASRRMMIETHDAQDRRTMILRDNDGKLPGLSGMGSEFVWVVIPDDDADGGFPLMLHPA